MLDKCSRGCIIIGMAGTTTFLDRFLPDCSPRRRNQIVALGSVMPAILIAALAISHLDTQLADMLWKLGVDSTRMLAGVWVGGGIGGILIALFFFSLTRKRTGSSDEADTTSWVAEAAKVAVAVLKAWLAGRTGWFSSPAIAPAAQPEPVISRDRATMRERRSHRRAVHILTSRSAAKGDGHAAAALTYSFAAVTA